MGYSIKQSQVAQPILFLLIASSDHLTGNTGKTPTVTLSKNGGAFAAPSGAVTELANGWYQVAGNATDANILGPLILHATEASSDPVDDVFPVVAQDPSGGVVLASNGLDSITVEAGVNARQALSPILAACAAVLSGAGTGTILIKAGNNPGTTRITATTDASGNRTAITLNLPA